MDESERNPWDAPEDDPTPADESTPTPPQPRAPVEAPAASAAPPSASAAPVAAPAPAAPPPNGNVEDPDADPNRNRVVLIALAAFVVIAVVGFILSQGGKDNQAQNADPGVGTTVVGGGGGSTVPAQALVIKGTDDPFSRADDVGSLGVVPNGTKWAAQKGSTWGVSGGQAYVAKPDTNPLHRNIATVLSGFANGQVQVTIAKMVPTAGIIFRYTGECSYWALESSPAYATWNVTKVDKCNATQVTNTGQTNIADGTTVGVVLTDSTIAIVINGKVVKTIQDASLSDNPGNVGITVSGEDSGKARFDDFIAGGPDGQGILTADVGKAPTTTAP